MIYLNIFVDQVAGLTDPKEGAADPQALEEPQFDQGAVWPFD